MTQLELLNKLDSEIGLPNLIKAGVLSYKLSLWREVYLRYDALTSSGVSSKVAIIEVNKQFGLKRSTIFKIRKNMMIEYEKSSNTHSRR